MATEGRPGPDHLTHFERLCEDPSRYHLLLALRIIEAEFADAPPMGRAKRPKADPMRLGQEATMAFPDHTLTAVEAPVGDKPGQLTNTFFGLFGPHGPLPQHLTEYARERERSYKDPTLVAFANMLTHRVMGLFYRAWTAGQPAAAFDRDGARTLEEKLAAIGGYFGQDLTERDAMPDLSRRYFTGYMMRGPRNPDGLVSILSSFFSTPVRVQEFIGSWLELDPTDRWSIGAASGLGQGTSVGSRVWARNAKFRIRIGPLPLEEYRKLLPGSASLARLSAIVRSYVGEALDWDVNLILRAEDVPQAILGRDTQLGLTSWVGSRSGTGDADDLYISALETRGTAGIGVRI